MNLIRLVIFVIGPLLGMTGSAQDFNMQLINGRLVQTGEYPEVVWMNRMCTASLIGPRVLVTAGHCVRDGGTINFQVGQTQYTSRATVSPIYERGGRRANSSTDHDVALALVSKEVTGIKFASVGPMVQSAQRLTVIGYGCTNSNRSGGNDGTLRVGESTVSRFVHYDAILQQQGGSVLCSGDSGGPVFERVGDAFAEDHVIVAVNSKSDLFSTSLVTLLGSQASVDFMRTFSRNNNVKICGLDGHNCNQAQPEPEPEPEPEPGPNPSLCISQRTKVIASQQAFDQRFAALHQCMF